MLLKTYTRGGLDYLCISVLHGPHVRESRLVEPHVHCIEVALILGPVVFKLNCDNNIKPELI